MHIHHKNSHLTPTSFRTQKCKQQTPFASLCRVCGCVFIIILNVFADKTGRGAFSFATNEPSLAGAQVLGPESYNVSTNFGVVSVGTRPHPWHSRLHPGVLAQGKEGIARGAFMQLLTLLVALNDRRSAFLLRK